MNDRLLTARKKGTKSTIYGNDEDTLVNRLRVPQVSAKRVTRLLVIEQKGMKIKLLKWLQTNMICLILCY